MKKYPFLSRLYRRTPIATTCAALILGFGSACSDEVANDGNIASDKPFFSIVDDCGRQVSVYRKPETIVSLAPSVSDMLVALGATDKLRGVTKWCDRDEAAAVERIGDMMSPDLERIISLRPDLVLGTEMTPRHIYDTLESAGIPCIMFKHQGLQDVMDDMASISAAMGEEERGAAVLRDMAKRRDELLARVSQGTQGLKVALLYDVEYMGSAGKGSWVDDMLSSIGLDNIANRAASPWPRLSKEALLVEQPDYIILALPLDEAEHESFRANLRAFKEDSVWKQVRAINEDRIVFVPANYLNIPGARTLDAMTFIAERVYGWQ